MAGDVGVVWLVVIAVVVVDAASSEVDCKRLVSATDVGADDVGAVVDCDVVAGCVVVDSLDVV